MPSTIKNIQRETRRAQAGRCGVELLVHRQTGGAGMKKAKRDGERIVAADDVEALPQVFVQLLL